MASFQQTGTTFVDGTSYTSADFNNAINNATLLKALIDQWAQKTTLEAADRILIHDMTADLFKYITLGSIAAYIGSAVYYGVDSGVADSYVVTTTVTPPAYATGMKVMFVAAHANTGASLININGLGTQQIRFNGAALTANMILANGFYSLVHDGTYFELMNPNISVTNIANSQLATMADQTMKGNVSGGSATPSDLTQAQIRTLLGLGSAAYLNVGTSANNVVQLDAVGLPAVNGSQLTGVLGAASTFTTSLNYTSGYFAMGGVQSSSNAFGFVSSRNMTLNTLSVTISGGSGAGDNNWAVSKNGVDTSLKVTINGSSGSGTDNHNVTIISGDVIAIHCSTSGASSLSATFKATPTS